MRWPSCSTPSRKLGLGQRSCSSCLVVYYPKNQVATELSVFWEWSAGPGPLCAKSTREAGQKSTPTDWDAAIAGNSALQEAFMKAVDHEMFHRLGAAHGCAVLDIKSFYDHIRWTRLAGAAVDLGFPGIALQLEMQLCMGPRILSQFGAYSQPYQATRSIVQGLRNGVRFGRCLTHYVMDALCSARVASSQRIWVDDLYIGQRGSSAAVRRSLGAGVSLIRDELHERDLTLVSKSVVLCGSMADSKAIAHQLRKQGIDIQAVRQAGYLGIDLGGGRRAARATRVSRVIRAKARNTRLRGFAFASKCYSATKRVQIAGPQASAIYGHQIHGIFGVERCAGCDGSWERLLELRSEVVV